jgi:hypothetical protein
MGSETGLRRECIVSSDLLALWDSLIRRDPAGRGLISSEVVRGPLCAGHFAKAARDLAERGQAVGIVTGFFIPHADPAAAETDGPPGAALLAAALKAVDIDCRLITDPWCANAVTAAAEAMGLDRSTVLTAPARCDAWTHEFLQSPFGRSLTHLVSIERVGPSHTLDSLAAQRREGRVPREQFESSVPVETRGSSHNMRARIIDEWTGDLYRLFERVQEQRPDVRTIGVGDGGNELGMGSIPWEELVARVERENSARIPCRIATDWTIVAGTSNWGGAALAAAVCHLKGRDDALVSWTCRQQEDALQHLVDHGPAVDGIVGSAQATVDGLPFITYIQPWRSIRESLAIEF